VSAASVVRALWPAARRILIKIGRWVIRRVRKVGAQRLAKAMRKRALGFQTVRLNAAKRRGDAFWAGFRRKQIRRWLNAAAWLRDNAWELNRAVVDGLDRLALADRIPMTLPGEGRA
jgi:hypothetical protein